MDSAVINNLVALGQAHSSIARVDSPRLNTLPMCRQAFQNATGTPGTALAISFRVTSRAWSQARTRQAAGLLLEGTRQCRQAMCTACAENLRVRRWEFLTMVRLAGAEFSEAISLR